VRTFLTPAVQTPHLWSYTVGTPGVWTGYPLDAKYTAFRNPTTYYDVWFDPELKKRPTSFWPAYGTKRYVTVYDALLEALWDIGGVCGLAFYESDNPNTARWRIRFLERETLWQYSKNFKNYDDGLASDNWCINPNGWRDIYLSNRYKRSSPLSPQLIQPINVKHFFLRALMFGYGFRSHHPDAYGFKPYNALGYPNPSWSNSNCSTAIYYPWSVNGRRLWGYAGASVAEQNFFIQKFGLPWLYRFDLGIQGDK
jgi:hypothetical protein